MRGSRCWPVAGPSTSGTAPVRYRIVHQTGYRYNAPVTRCRNEAHLRPRDTDRQTCLASELVVEPTPTSWSERADFYGNPVAAFVVDGPFEEMTVTATSSVDVSDGDPLPAAGPGWRGARPADQRPEPRDARRPGVLLRVAAGLHGSGASASTRNRPSPTGAPWSTRSPS